MYLFDKTNQIHRQIAQLADIGLSVLRFYPEKVTINPQKIRRLPVVEEQAGRLATLQKMLIHVSTLINSNYRMKTKQGQYISEETDYINALTLMQDVVKYYHIRKTVYEHELTALIREHYPDGEVFTRRQLMELTGYSRTHAHLIITTMLERRQIVRVGGNRRFGYTYRLV